MIYISARDFPSVGDCAPDLSKQVELMFAQLPKAADARALDAFRSTLAEIDPDAKIFMDDHSGEVLVKGQFDAQQLADAVERSGLGIKVLVAGGGGCCGGCG